MSSGVFFLKERNLVCLLVSRLHHLLFPLPSSLLPSLPFYISLITKQTSSYFFFYTSVVRGCSLPNFTVIWWFAPVFYFLFLLLFSAASFHCSYHSDGVKTGFRPTVTQIQPNRRNVVGKLNVCLVFC